jgi:hypothetical protein
LGGTQKMLILYVNFVEVVDVPAPTPMRATYAPLAIRRTPSPAQQLVTVFRSSAGQPLPSIGKLSKFVKMCFHVFRVHVELFDFWTSGRSE